MSEQRPPAPDSDDAFERELRALLRARAAGPLPGRLREAIDLSLDASPAGPRRSTGRFLRVVLVTAAALLLVWASFNPISMVMEATHVAGGAGASPSFAASPTPAIVWDTGTVRLVADAMRIRAGGRVFTGQVPGVRVGGSAGDLHQRTLEVEWVEHGLEQRLSIYFAADAASWWISEIRTRDGAVAAEWVTYPGPGWRIPFGGTYRGPLRLALGPYGLEFDGLALSAFSPDNLPRDFRFCRPPAAGEDLFDGVDPTALTPDKAQAWLVARGWCHSFRYEYSFGDGLGYAERWCIAPPGRIFEAIMDADLVIVFVQDAVRAIHTPRPQPPIGWGC